MPQWIGTEGENRDKGTARRCLYINDKGTNDPNALWLNPPQLGASKADLVRAWDQAM